MRSLNHSIKEYLDDNPAEINLKTTLQEWRYT